MEVSASRLIGMVMFTLQDSGKIRARVCRSGFGVQEVEERSWEQL